MFLNLKENSSTSRHKNTWCARERDADRKRARACREIVSKKKKKRSLAVGVSFSELLPLLLCVQLRTFFKRDFYTFKEVFQRTFGRNAR